MATQLGMIVGIDSNGMDKAYRVILSTMTQKSERQYDWNFQCKLVHENELINVLKSNKIRWLNIELLKGKIHGSSGDLKRFDSTGVKPYVIISQLMNSEGKIIGYKIANYNGGVTNIRAKELVSFGLRCNKQGLIPVQNAIFIPGDQNGKLPHYRSYEGHPFMEELIITNKTKNTETRRINSVKNEKTLSKLSEIYTKEQITQLRLGKEHGVQIRIYANPALSAEQMEQLRKGLERHVNVRPFAFPEYKAECMSFYTMQLATKSDIRSYVNPKYNLGQLGELAMAADEGLDISKMSDPSLSVRQMAERRIRMEQGVFFDENVKIDGSWI